DRRKDRRVDEEVGKFHRMSLKEFWLPRAPGRRASPIVSGGPAPRGLLLAARCPFDAGRCELSPGASAPLGATAAVASCRPLLRRPGAASDHCNRGPLCTSCISCACATWSCCRLVLREHRVAVRIAAIPVIAVAAALTHRDLLWCDGSARAHALEAVHNDRFA